MTEKTYEELDVKDFKESIDNIIDNMIIQSSAREAVTEKIKYLSEKYGFNKSILRKVATAIYKNTIEDEEEKVSEFDQLVELYSK